MNGSPLLYAWYGDDFTGSTDVLQQLASSGVDSVLFLCLPEAQHLGRFPSVKAVGIAGDSRSRSPGWMRENLPCIFRKLQSFQAPVNHYKVCSTFDSSPEIGSIGCAIEVGLQVFTTTAFVPVVIAAPHLRRFVCFGNLFAANERGEVVRIDRHPMRNHPATPMKEPDLRRHLKAQTTEPAGLVDLTQWTGVLIKLPDERIVLFDGTDVAMNQRVGEVLWNLAVRQPLFSASSSGLPSALVHAWRKAGILPPATSPFRSPQVASPLLVVSGSCSATTERQIQWALQNGFLGLAISAEELVTHPADVIDRSVCGATAILRSGSSVILYTALGGATSEDIPANVLGRALGKIVAALLDQQPVRRVLFCGGDTSSYAVQQLDLYALTWLADLAPGAPLCRSYSEDTRLDGVELVLKGGQVGPEDFFARVLHAHRFGQQT